MLLSHRRRNFISEAQFEQDEHEEPCGTGGQGKGKGGCILPRGSDGALKQNVRLTAQGCGRAGCGLMKERGGDVGGTLRGLIVGPVEDVIRELHEANQAN